MFSIIAKEEKAASFSALQDLGYKAKYSSELDMELFGYINRAIVDMHHSDIYLVEDNDLYVIIQFTNPKGGV